MRLQPPVRAGLQARRTCSGAVVDSPATAAYVIHMPRISSLSSSKPMLRTMAVMTIFAKSCE